MKFLKRLLLLAAITSCNAIAPAWSADTLASPAGPVILTVSGMIKKSNQGDSAVFDREMLEKLGMSELQVTTPWTEGSQTFEGVLASKVLDAVGASGSMILARAINDYQVKIPASDFRRYPVLLALKHNGRYMRVRDKGPIWIVYPRETFPELDTDLVTDRWVWQLSDLIIQ